MSIKKLVVLFTFSLSYNFIIAQSPIVKISDKIKLKNSEILDNYVVATNDAFFVKAYKQGGLFSSKVEYFLQKYDQKFNLIYSNKFEVGKKDAFAVNILNIKNNIALLTREENKKDDYLSYSFVPIGFDGKAGKPTNIAKFKFEKRKDAPEYSITRSQDSTLLAFVAYVDNNDNEDVLQCFVATFDHNLNAKWNKKVSLKKSQEVIQILSSSVNNEGKVYVLYKEYEGDKAKESKKSKETKKDKPAYDIKLAILSEDDQNDEFITLDINNFYLTNASLKVLPDGNMGVFGLYSTTKKHFTNGIFTLRVDSKTDSVYQLSKKEFTEADLEILSDEKNTSKDKGEEGLDATFNLIDISYLADGGAYVTMEENYSYTVSNYVNRSWNYTTYYVSKDLIPIKLNSKGEIEDIYIIPKRQSFANNDSYNSSIVLVNDSGYHVVYNEDEDNLKKPIGEKKSFISSLGDCVAVMTSIDNSGKMKRVALFDKDNTKAVLMPKSSMKMNNRELFFIAARGWSLFSGGSDRRIGTITLP